MSLDPSRTRQRPSAGRRPLPMPAPFPPSGPPRTSSAAFPPFPSTGSRWSRLLALQQAVHKAPSSTACRMKRTSTLPSPHHRLARHRRSHVGATADWPKPRTALSPWPKRQPTRLSTLSGSTAQACRTRVSFASPTAPCRPCLPPPGLRARLGLGAGRTPTRFPKNLMSIWRIPSCSSSAWPTCSTGLTKGRSDR